MSYVDSQLLPNEAILYRARLHRSLYTVSFVFGAMALVAVIFAVGQPSVWWVALAFGVVTALTFVSSWFRSSSSEFAVTDKRVIIKVGLVRRRTLETMLGKVEGIGVDQSLMGRMLGFGTIVVTGTGGTKEEFDRIANPLEFRRQVQAAISASDAQRAVVLPQGADPLAERQERECPYCAERILVKAKVCRFCGRDVGVAAPT
jgi:uncharacterized membrane protein YdbT with pleckstrin-like domain